MIKLINLLKEITGFSNWRMPSLSKLKQEFKIEQEMNLTKKELSKNKIIITNTTMKEIINVLKINIVMNFFKEKFLIKMIESEEI